VNGGRKNLVKPLLTSSFRSRAPQLLRAAVAAGTPQVTIARELGVGKARVGQIIHDG